MTLGLEVYALEQIGFTEYASPRRRCNKGSLDGAVKLVHVRTSFWAAAAIMLGCSAFDRR